VIEWRETLFSTRGEVIQIELIAFHIVSCGKILKRHDKPLNLCEAARHGNKVQPAIAQRVSPITLELELILIPDEPKRQFDLSCIPRRGSTDTDLPQSAQRPTFISLSVVFLH
jgi:hypothetical protein